MEPVGEPPATLFPVTPPFLLLPVLPILTMIPSLPSSSTTGDRHLRPSLRSPIPGAEWRNTPLRHSGWACCWI
jgi:hypothetical protein